jgi:hypothetical protein
VSITSPDQILSLAREFTVDDSPVALGAGGGLVAVAGAEGTVRVAEAGVETGAFELSGGALQV